MSERSIMIEWGTLGVNYLRVAESLAKRLVESGNPWIIVGDTEIDPKDYDILTEASDTNVAILLSTIFTMKLSFC